MDIDITTKVKMTVEKFENGIAVKWSDEEGNKSNNVALDENEASLIGKEIWSDLYNLMDHFGTNKVKIRLEYEPIIEEV